MATLIPPGGGERTSEDPEGVIKLRGEDTGGLLAVIEQTLEPGRLIRPHVHDHDVWLQCLGGLVGVRVGDETVVAKSGAWVLKPRNVVHSMWNAATEPSRVMEIVTPAGFEKFMRETAVHARQETLDEATFSELCSRYGRFFDDWPSEEGWIERTRKEYGLS